MNSPHPLSPYTLLCANANAGTGNGNGVKIPTV